MDADMQDIRQAAQAAIALCDWIAEASNTRGSINGLAAQVRYALETALAHPVPAAQPVAVPKGWKLVPVEPTQAMRDAGDPKTWILLPGECWAAMLAAAPEAPAVPQGEPQRGIGGVK